MLPQDIRVCILQLLSINDVVKVGCVDKEWRTTVMNYIQTKEHSVIISNHYWKSMNIWITRNKPKIKTVFVVEAVLGLREPCDNFIASVIDALQPYRLSVVTLFTQNINNDIMKFKRLQSVTTVGESCVNKSKNDICYEFPLHINIITNKKTRCNI